MTFASSFLELDEVITTQDIAAGLILAGNRAYSVVFAHDQVRGKGRLGRIWKSERDQSLTMTLIFWNYPNWPKPWLIGMAASIVAAEAIDCEVRWPNDLTFGDRKVGGVLSEIHVDETGDRISIVGIGINLLQDSFESSLPNAVSVKQATGQPLDPAALAANIADRFAGLPEPREWGDIQPRWEQRDKTPGKHYKLADGREAIANSVDDEGALRCRVGSEELRVMAAEAVFGI